MIEWHLIGTALALLPIVVFIDIWSRKPRMLRKVIYRFKNSPNGSIAK